MAQESADGKSVRVSAAYFQPIASDDVAAALAKVAVAAPLNGTIEVAGPERVHLDELVRRVLAAKGDAREVITDGSARYFGARLGKLSLTPAAPSALGEVRFAEWLGSAGPGSSHGSAQPASRTNGKRMTEGSFAGVEGVTIFTRAWQPVTKPRGVVVISHGLNAHSGLYQWAAEQLTSNGLAVYALDHRGRGRSEGERFFVKKFADWTTDLATFIDIVKTREPGLPVFLLGHSAGGVIACGYALEHQDEIAGLICEDFAYQVPGPEIALAIVKGISRLAPHAHVLKLKNEDFSRDPAVVAALNADPLIANEAQPSETVAELVRADELLKRSFAEITLPLLILHGTADKVTKPSGSKEFYEKAGSKDKTLKLYEGHFHDLLADVGKQQVMADIQAWIDVHLATQQPRSRNELRSSAEAPAR
jgi:alpha-beta hydrolase superfamily lysophospholipase